MLAEWMEMQCGLFVLILRMHCCSGSVGSLGAKSLPDLLGGVDAIPDLSIVHLPDGPDVSVLPGTPAAAEAPARKRRKTVIDAATVLSSESVPAFVLLCEGVEWTYTHKHKQTHKHTHMHTCTTNTVTGSAPLLGYFPLSLPLWYTAQLDEAEP